MKRMISTILLAACTIWAQASEVWLNTAKFVYKPGEIAGISFQTGDNLMGKPWQLATTDILKLELHEQGGVTDVKPAVKAGDKDNLQLTLQQEGNSIVSLEAAPLRVTHTADQFNEYLKAAGLDEIAFNRQAAGTSNKGAVESRTRYVKLVLQTGTRKDDTAIKIIGTPVEIVPNTNPYSASKGQTIKFTVRYKGKPWFGTRVRVFNLEDINFKDSRTTIQNLHTGKDGTIEVIISNTGTWMLTTTVMEPSREQGIQWQSYEASYMFGIQ